MGKEQSRETIIRDTIGKIGKEIDASGIERFENQQMSLITGDNERFQYLAPIALSQKGIGVVSFGLGAAIGMRMANAIQNVTGNYKDISFVVDLLNNADKPSNQQTGEERYKREIDQINMLVQSQTLRQTVAKYTIDQQQGIVTGFRSVASFFTRL